MLLDRLLQFALIEARSAERFRLLSEGLEDAYLREFYRKFMISEAGHYRLFIDLANEYIPEEKVRKRWAEWLAFEADMIGKLTVRGIGCIDMLAITRPASSNTALIDHPFHENVISMQTLIPFHRRHYKNALRGLLYYLNK